MYQRRCQIVVFLGLVVAAAPALRGDDTPSPSISPVITALLPDDAIGVIVVNPQGALKASSKLQAVGDEFTKNANLPLAQIEQMIGVLGYPTPEQMGGQHRPFETAGITRLTAPWKGDELAARLMAPAKPERSEVAGKSFFVAAKEGERPALGRPSCVALIDDRTFISGEETDVRAMLAVQQSKSPLVKALATADLTADMTAIVVIRDDLRATAAALKASGQLPPLLLFADLPAQTDTIALRVKAAPTISLSLTLEAKDAASAEKIAAVLPAAKQMLMLVATQFRNAPRDNLPADVRAAADFLLEKLDKVAADFAPRQAGRRVTVEITGLGTLDDWVSNVEVGVAHFRRQARRMVSLNNLRQIGLAMNSYHLAYGHFPARAIFSKDGKPLLSWRVALLPQIDRMDLYRQFHLDEPWDSEHNKPLSLNLPQVYMDPERESARDGHTRYVVITGKDTVFNGDHALRIDDIHDGCSNTILAVEAGADKSVVWTKPDDIEFDPKQPLAALGTLDASGFNAVLCDGSVHRLSKSIDEETLRRLIQPNDALPIDPTKF